MKRPKKNGVEEVAEHNQPTEPFDFGVSPYAPTVTADRLPPETPSVAMVRAAPQQPQVGQAPLIGAYPFLPVSPVRQNSQAEGGMTVPAKDVRVSVAARRRVRKVFPALVGLCFVLVQVLVLVSFVCKVVGQWDSVLWVNVLYVISDVLVWPVQTLVHQLPAPMVIPEQIFMLLAILIYGIVSRIVVRGLKLLLQAQKV
jgi:hypothetical protein